MKKIRYVCILMALALSLFAFAGCQNVQTEAPQVSASSSDAVISSELGVPVSSADDSRDVEQASSDGAESGFPASSTADGSSTAPIESSAASQAVPASTSTVQETSSSQPYTLKVPFAEGTTMAKMFMTLDDKGIADIDALFTAAETMDVSGYPLAAAVAMRTGRCYRLEGYLFPDTYEFYVGDSPENILKKMLSNTEKRVSQKYHDRAAELGYSMDEAVILASLIQKETGSVAEMPNISSVLHNRIAASMRLQLDATITYVENVILPFHEGTRDTFAPTYNTYKCAALPAGPIGNPGLDALEAALWPAETSFYYFAMDSAGNTYYSETYEEHVAVCTEHGIGIHTQE